MHGQIHNANCVINTNLPPPWYMNLCLQSEKSFPLVITTLWWCSCRAHLVNTIIPTWLEGSVCPDRGGLLVIKHLLAICCAASITWELELKTLTKPQWTHSRRAADGGMGATWSSLCWKLAVLYCSPAQRPSTESLNSRDVLSWLKLNYSIPLFLFSL